MCVDVDSVMKNRKQGVKGFIHLHTYICNIIRHVLMTFSVVFFVCVYKYIYKIFYLKPEQILPEVHVLFVSNFSKIVCFIEF